MILTLDKYPTASMLFNSARKTCEAYMIFFIAIPLEIMLHAWLQMLKRNNTSLNNKLNKVMMSAKDSKGFKSLE